VKIRLQKYMASAGVASRRKCEKLISDGKVKVNGKVSKLLGVKIDPNIDSVEVDGKKITYAPEKTYVILNKPLNCVSTVSDPQGRKTVLDYVKGINKRIYPVGRLDYDTEGLLLLTDDGELTYKLTHPKHEITKTYIAQVTKCPDSSGLEKLRNGIQLEDGLTAPAQIKIIKMNQSCWLSIVIHEGRNRQVRRMLKAVGCDVLFLKREKIGKLTLGKLQPGNWRFLSESEINYLKSI
jgi:pseudouridine synthase